MNATSTSMFLGGKLLLTQPEKGHRAGTDAILLAACLSPKPEEIVYDLGSGVGAAGLAITARVPFSRVVLVEIDAGIADLARANIAQNACAAQASVVEADVTQRLSGTDSSVLVAGSADHVIMNPPFHLQGTVRPPPDRYRAGAHIHNDGGDEAWIRCAHGLLRPKGSLSIIHRSDALPRLLEALVRRFGDIRVKPILPRTSQASTRVLIRAVRDSRAPFTLLAPIVLHEADGGFTPYAQALHYGDTVIEWE